MTFTGEIVEPGAAPNNGEDWLSPVAALNKFNPPRAIKSPEYMGEERQLRYGFVAARMGLLIAPGTVSEIMPLPPVYPIPNAMPSLRGMSNLRGTLVPVYDLDSLLGVPSASAEDPMLLVLDKRDESVGVVVQGFPKALYLNAELKLAGLPPLPEALVAHVHDAYVVDDMVWLEFDHRNFFTSLVEGGS